MSSDESKKHHHHHTNRPTNASNPMPTIITNNSKDPMRRSPTYMSPYYKNNVSFQGGCRSLSYNYNVKFIIICDNIWFLVTFVQKLIFWKFKKSSILELKQFTRRLLNIVQARITNRRTILISPCMKFT